MKFYLLFFFLFLFHCKAIAQSFTILDEESNTPITFATFRQSNLGVRSDANGKVDLSLFDVSKPIDISKLGYKNQSFCIGNLKNNIIYLVVDEILLDTVLLSVNKSPILKSAKLKKSKIFNSASLFTNNIIISKINSQKNLSLVSIGLPLYKPRGFKNRKDLFENRFLMLRLTFFTLNFDGSTKIVYESEPLPVKSYDNDEIVFDLTKANIILNADDIYVMIENLGVINDKGDFVEDSDLFIANLGLTSKKNSLFEVITYRRTNLGYKNFTDLYNPRFNGKADVLESSYVLNFILSYRYLTE